MVDIDWGDLTPSARQRARAEAKVHELSALEGPVIGLRRKGAGYEALLENTPAPEPVELRLHGEDLGAVVERAVDLIAIVTRRRARPD